MAPESERRARVALSFLAKQGDPVPGAALRTRTATEVLALVTGADADGEALLAGEVEDAALHRVVQRWRERLGEIPSTARLAAWRDRGSRLIIPGDDEWPTQLDDLGDAWPIVLWRCGTADLRLTLSTRLQSSARGQPPATAIMLPSRWLRCSPSGGRRRVRRRLQYEFTTSAHRQAEVASP
jgi:hypothetical protein